MKVNLLSTVELCVWGVNIYKTGSGTDLGYVDMTHVFYERVAGVKRYPKKK
jgi:hypothetical protein